MLAGIPFATVGVNGDRMVDRMELIVHRASYLKSKVWDV